MMLNLGKYSNIFRTKDFNYDDESKKCLIMRVGSWNYVIEDYFMNKQQSTIFLNHTVFK